LYTLFTPQHLSLLLGDIFIQLTKWRTSESGVATQSSIDEERTIVFSEMWKTCWLVSE